MTTEELRKEFDITETPDGIIVTGWRGKGSRCVIPDGVIGIDEKAFSGCSSLTGITIPDSVTNIGEKAFADCRRLAEFQVSEKNSAYTAIDGVLFNRDITELVLFPPARNGEYMLPESVITIGDGAFSWCVGLTKITIPDSVTGIGANAFHGCKGLTGITLPNSVTGIGDRAFSWCDNLTGITIPDSVTSIGEWIFENCNGLTSVYIGNGLTVISRCAFWGCKSLIKVHIGSGVTDIGGAAFRKCSSLTEISLPDSVTSIGEGAFLDCSSLTKIIIPNSITRIDNGVFSWCKGLTEITIPDGVNSIGERAFEHCSKLEEITIPDSVTSIGTGAFTWCTSLTSLTVPDGVTSIGDRTFSDCSSLTNLTIPDSVASIGEEAFSSCASLKNFYLPAHIKSIGSEAFKECFDLRAIRIPDDVKKIGMNIFGDCFKLVHIAIPAPVPLQELREALSGIVQHAIIYGKHGSSTEEFAISTKHIFKELEEYPGENGPDAQGLAIDYEKLYNAEIEDGILKKYDSTHVRSYYAVIPSGVRVIAQRLFDREHLKYVEFPVGLREIGDAAFRDCELREVILPDGVLSIEGHAFQHNRLEKIRLPLSIVNVGADAFDEGCLSNHPEHPEFQVIGSVLIKYAGGKTNITVPAGITCIASGAFRCVKSKVKRIQLPDSLVGISSRAFYGCTKLETVRIPDSVTYIGFQAFDKCPEIRGLVIPDNVSRSLSGYTGVKSGRQMIWENPAWTSRYAELDKDFSEGILKKEPSLIHKGSYYVLKKDGCFYSEENEFPSEKHIKDFIVKRYYKVAGGFVAAIKEDGTVIWYAFGEPHKNDSARVQKIAKGLQQESNVSKIIPCFYQTIQLLVLHNDGSLATYGSGGKSAKQMIELSKGRRIKNIYALYDDFIAEAEEGKLIGTGDLSSVEKIHSYSKIKWIEDLPALLFYFSDDRVVMCSHKAEVIQNFRKIVPFKYGNLILGTNGKIVDRGVGSKDEEIEQLNETGEIADIRTFGPRFYQSLAVLYRSGDVLVDGKFIVGNVRCIDTVRDRLYADFQAKDFDTKTEKNPISAEAIYIGSLENFASYPPEEKTDKATPDSEDTELEKALRDMADSARKDDTLSDEIKKALYNIFTNIYGYGTFLFFGSEEIKQQFFDWEYNDFLDAIFSAEIMSIMNIDVETAHYLNHIETLFENTTDIYEKITGDEKTRPKLVAYFKRIAYASPRYGFLIRKALRRIADIIEIDVKI